MAIHTATGEQPAYRKRLGYQAMLLGGICYMVAILIIFGNISTKELIAEALKQDKLTLLSQVLPTSIYDNDLLEDVISINSENTVTNVNVATLEGLTSGYSYTTIGNGYSGDIVLLLGINPDGEILGVRVLSHAETPGLGDKIELSKDDWIKGFDGLSLNNTPEKSWAVKKDGGQFDHFTGATITPRAVVSAVYEGLKLYRNQRDQFSYIAKPLQSPNKLEHSVEGGLSDE